MKELSVEGWFCTSEWRYDRPNSVNWTWSQGFMESKHCQLANYPREEKIKRFFKGKAKNVKLWRTLWKIKQRRVSRFPTHWNLFTSVIYLRQRRFLLVNVQDSAQFLAKMQLWAILHYIFHQIPLSRRIGRINFETGICGPDEIGVGKNRRTLTVSDARPLTSLAWLGAVSVEPGNRNWETIKTT